MRLKGCVFNQVVSSTGAPHGTVLSQFLFTLRTSDFQYTTTSSQWEYKYFASRPHPSTKRDRADCISYLYLLWQQYQSQELKKLKKLIKKAGSILGTPLEPVEIIMQRMILHKMKNIMENRRTTVSSFRSFFRSAVRQTATEDQFLHTATSISMCSASRIYASSYHGCKATEVTVRGKKISYTEVRTGETQTN
ncbi:hypothetical protein ILYODFUR_024244 [Ilyodon furcidens]|uniref:Uncharacterized protein n=1 Tax=Ilyodon furcidens TaxID=33524 RepID=A0ABV0VJE4_9TELE